MKKKFSIIILACFATVFSFWAFSPAQADDQADCNKYCADYGYTGNDWTNCTTKCQADKAAGKSGNGNAGNAGTGNQSGGAEFPNPLSIDTVEGLLGKIMSYLQGIIAVVAVGFMIIGGIIYMTSAGNEKAMTRAKNCWTGAVIGLAIALAAPSLLKDLRAVLGAKAGSGSSAVDSALGIKQIALNVLDLLLSVVGIIAIISLVIGGIMYMTAYGDEKRMETGKKIFNWSIVGILVSLGSLIVVKQVMSILGYSV